ncbi:MAG: HupE/UreJ family protein [Xenococcaceae cyanobacterium MO_188.B29]|nr:HupE/UreJ family protein [Xenococcaceae cyanobacterium MO_188.B29]
MLERKNMSGKRSYGQQLWLHLNRQWLSTVGIISCLGFLIFAPGAIAHHPLGGKLPANFFEGLMSGFGHPVIGFDHLAFIIASGLIAVGTARGILIPIAFVITTGIGALIHLQAINLPVPEIIIAASVAVFGILLIIGNKQTKAANYTLVVAGLAALAGLFHGYAYGEGIFGAEPTPLVAYLIGFTVIQLGISLGVYLIASTAVANIQRKYLTHFAGGAIASTGIVFLSSAIIG